METPHSSLPTVPQVPVAEKTDYPFYFTIAFDENGVHKSKTVSVVMVAFALQDIYAEASEAYPHQFNRSVRTKMIDIKYESIVGYFGPDIAIRCLAKTPMYIHYTTAIFAYQLYCYLRSRPQTRKQVMDNDLVTSFVLMFEHLQ